MDNANNITINIIEPGSDVPVPDTGLFTHGIGGAEASIIATVGIVIVIAIAAIMLCLRKKKINLKPSKHTPIILSILAIITSIATFTGLTFNSIYNHTNAKEGDLTVTTEDADFTIEVGDEPVFAVLPVDVKVEEATPAGYTLTSYTETTGLVSTTDDTNIIPMVATSEGELAALKDNTYGLSLSLVKPTSKDEAVYTSLSTVADNPTFITDKDYKATETNDTTTIYYGFYITPDTPYGTYKSSDIYYDATTNSSKVIFNGNGLYFNDDPEQTTNDVEYITGITSNTAKYSHTPNINGAGIASDNLSSGIQMNEIITIPGATTLHISFTYGGGYKYGWLHGFASFWDGAHANYTPENDYAKGVQNCGEGQITDGRYYSNNETKYTVECSVSGNTVTFGYFTRGGPSSVDYGYYAIVTGYDADGNAIYLPGNIEVGGEYQDPAQDLPYIFLGWNEDKEATTATYESKNDIELNLPLIKGKTTELYAIWQHVTKIHFDGNGSTSGEIPDKLLKPGEGASLCGYYYSRDGYVFNNWNTKPDGSGESYGQCYWYTVPADQSVELNLYAQWTPVTTIIYDGNGGEGSQQQQTIRAGNTGSIWGNWNYFDKDGYGFTDWNTNPDGSGTTYYEGQEFVALDQPRVITLYAQWALTTITFNGNNADEGTMAPITIAAGSVSALPQNIYTKEGYVFAGWNTKEDGTGVSYSDKAQYSAAAGINDNVTLYAQWLPTTTLTFSGNGADSGTMASITIAAGALQPLTANAFVRDGYAFIGWNTVATPTEQNPGIQYEDMATYVASNTRPDSLTLYAQWKLLPVIGDFTYMQDFATLSEVEKTGVLSSMPQGQQYQLKDSRDQKDYYISKLADGNVWMTQNLDLDIKSNTTYTSADTDISADWKPVRGTTTSTTWDTSISSPYSYNPGDRYWNGTLFVDDPSNTIINGTNTTGDGHSHVGNFYNWTAAVAMNDSSSYTNGKDAGQSICPAGWRLPTSGGDKSYRNLVDKGSLTVGVSGNIQNSPTYFVYGGSWRGSSSNFGNAGSYWTSRSYSIGNKNSYSLLFGANALYARTEAYSERYRGYSVRCVAR